jgi:hypothetical protein
MMRPVLVIVAAGQPCPELSQRQERSAKQPQANEHDDYEYLQHVRLLYQRVTQEIKSPQARYRGYT